METPASVLQFWFGPGESEVEISRQQAALWWSKNAELDHQIAERFGPYVDKAARRELASWIGTAQGQLALVILADQFPRNIFRDTPRAFAYDELAREWCAQGLRDGIDGGLRPIERVFFYLPLEHSESLADQERAVELFDALVAQASPQAKAMYEDFADYARRHRDIIARFGRFPHRNAILGRESTSEEIAFLREPGSSF